MKVEDVFFDPILKLPAERNPAEHKTFYLYATDLLNKYTSLISKIENRNEIFYFSIGGHTADELSVEMAIKIIHDICQALKEILDAYYEGLPNKSYNILVNLLQEKTIANKYPLSFLLRAFPFQDERFFYRIRFSEHNFLFTKEEMFHIPFDKREEVRTHRFGIPGYPTLYLSNCIYLAWEELGRPHVDQFQASRFELSKEYTEDLFYLDLSNYATFIRRRIKAKNEFINPNIGNFLLTFPLILLCSIKANDKDAYFKPEYIVPQLIMQYIRQDNKKIIGVKFLSTHVYQNDNIQDGILYNLAVPTRKSSNEGYCEYLSKIFKFTPPTSNQIIEIKDANTVSLHLNEQECFGINKEVRKIKLDNSKTIIYGETLFGRMEEYLKNIDALQF